MTGVIIILFFLALIGGAVFLVMTTMKKLNGTDGGVIASTKNMDNAQSFLPFVDISEDVINLGGFKYRAIIECTSVNYALKTDVEKNIIETSFRNFLNTLQFPVSFYLQTKEVNYMNILETLEKDVAQSKIDCPKLEHYAQIYYDEISHLKETIQNSKQKKKYIIVPYEDTIVMNELTPKEKEDYSRTEMNTRVTMLMENLPSMGIRGTRLDTGDLIELMYSIYHRDDDAIVENIVDGDYMKTIVSGLSQAQKQDALQQAIGILQDAESKLKFGVVNDRNPEKANELFMAITKNINELKSGLTDIESRGGLSILSSDEELFDKLDEDRDETEEMFENITNDDYSFKKYNSNEGGLK